MPQKGGKVNESPCSSYNKLVLGIKKKQKHERLAAPFFPFDGDLKNWKTQTLLKPNPE